MWRPVHVASDVFDRGLRPSLAGRVFDAARGAARLASEATLDLVLPPSCPMCAVPVASLSAVCLDCWKSVRFLERPWCERLGTPFPYDLGPGTLSAEAIANPPTFDRARSAVVYDGPVPDLVQAFKYADRSDLVPLITGWMMRAGGEVIGDADLIVPVPMHRWRLFRRRFNQAALIAREIARRGGKPYRPMVLIRTRRTRQQVGLSREARAENVIGAFKVPKGAKALIKGRRVLLIDDVFTTGVTLEAAARPLMRAGASAVDVLTFARVVAPG